MLSSEPRGTFRRVSSGEEAPTYTQYSLEFATCSLYFTNILFFADRQIGVAFQPLKRAFCDVLPALKGEVPVRWIPNPHRAVCVCREGTKACESS